MSEQNLNDPQTTRIQYVEPVESEGTIRRGLPGRDFFQPRGFFGKLFDTRFQDYVTPSIVKVIFWIAIIAALLTWITAIISGFATGVNRWGSFNPWYGLAALFLGWIPPLLSIIWVRVGLEAILALIRLSKDTRRIRHHLERGGSL